jgi:hypothetical protein
MLSCDRCRVVKKKCTRGEPCERCLKGGHECSYTAVRYEDEVVTKEDRLKARVQTLEDILVEYVGKEYGADMDFSILNYLSQGLGKRSFSQFRPSNLSQFSGFSYNINSDSVISSHVPVYEDTSKAQLKLFFGTYVKYVYHSYPFINLKHLKLLFNVRPYHTPILYITYLIGQLILLRKNKSTIYPGIEDNQFYRLAKYLISTQTHDNSLLHIQTLILIAEVELQNGLGIEGSLHNLQAIRKLQMFDLEKTPAKVKSASSLLYQRELEATWAMAKKTDAYIYTAARIPRTIRSTVEDWSKSQDHYHSYLLIDSMMKRFDRNVFDISEDELNQYLRYLSMELYCFTCALTDKFYKYKYEVKHNFDAIDKDTFMSEWAQASYFVRNHPLISVDGETFNKKFPLDHPHFNLFVTNYLLLQTYTLTVNQIMIDYMEESLKYDYPSPMSSDSQDEFPDFKKIRSEKVQNLIHLVYSTCPKRRRYIDQLTCVDYIFSLPHYYIYKFGPRKYSVDSHNTMIEVFDYFPCLGTIFYLNPINQNGGLYKEIEKYYPKYAFECGKFSNSNSAFNSPRSL